MAMARTFVFLLTLLCGCHPLTLDKEFVTKPSTVLATLDQSHPRLMLKDEDLDRLRKLHEKDMVLRRCMRDVFEEADGYCEKPALTYIKSGPRLLYVSRKCVRRMYALGLAFRWSGEKKYADKAVENLLAVCAFADWNPSHFLDTAEMSHAVGVGYDWLYSCLDAETRQKIRVGLIRNGLEPGLRAYNDGRWFFRSKSNWNQVCNGGLIVGALAIAESDPQYAEQIIPAAVRSLPRALKSYSPDGAWMEGPSYWAYATRYTAYGLSALHTALGKDFGLSKIRGLSETGLFPIYTTGPTGLFLNFADSGENNSRRPTSCMFWLARTYRNAFIADAEHAMIARYDADPQHVVWYVPPSGEKPQTRDLDRYFRGRVPVAVFRSDWDDPDALFVGVKGGYNQVTHGHLDLGNFEMDALGVRWARDLGKDGYNLPGYFDKKSGGKGWGYYRLNSHSHNVPLINELDQDAEGTAEVVRFESKKTSAFVLVDLTNAYKESAKKVMRGVRMVSGRRAVLVQDEFELEVPCEVAWGMTTDAEIAIGEKGVAVLTLKGKRLVARVFSPSGAEFSAESAEQNPPQSLNKGVRRLVVRLPKQAGDLRVAVLLSPVWGDDWEVKTVALKPLGEW